MTECNQTQETNAKTGIGFVLGLLVGSLIGAATAILTAPQSGTQTREYLKRKAFEAKGKATHMADEMKEDVGEWTTRAKGKMAEKMTEARGKVSQALHREPANGKPEVPAT